jgi:hypothetical protein
MPLHHDWQFLKLFQFHDLNANLNLMTVNVETFLKYSNINQIKMQIRRGLVSYKKMFATIQEYFWLF